MRTRGELKTNKTVMNKEEKEETASSAFRDEAVSSFSSLFMAVLFGFNSPLVLMSLSLF